MRPSPSSGPPPALVVAVAAVVGGWLAVRAWPGGPTPGSGGPADRAAVVLARPGATARVTRTVDGDTAVVAYRDGGRRATVTVRYLGIDAPESVDPDRPVGCFGPEASHRNRAWATGRVVRVVLDRERVDPYGRLIAALVPVGHARSLSERLVAGGYAKVLTIPPNGATAARLGRLESRAREGRRGLWRRCEDALPSGA